MIASDGKKSNNVSLEKSKIVSADFFGFPKVKWLQYTGKVGKCSSYRCQIFSGFHTPKIIKIRLFLTELLEK